MPELFSSFLFSPSPFRFAPKKPFTIRNLPKGSKALLKGLFFVGARRIPALATLQIQSCLGLVLVEECHILEPDFALGWAVNIGNSRQVVFNHSLTRQGIFCTNSHLVFNASLSYGEGQPSSFGIFGISIQGGQLELNQATIAPSDHFPHSQTPYGVFSKNTKIIVRGNPLSLIRGGKDIFGKPLPAFFDIGGPRATSILHIDPDVRFSGNLKTFGLRATIQQMPSLTARGTNLGGTIHGELHPPAGSSFVLWSALVATKTPTALGDLWLDLPSIFPQAAGFAKDRTDKPFAFAVPKVPQLLGLALAFQALSWDKKGFQLSNAAVTVLGQ
jgi:hypothetical protein